MSILSQKEELGLGILLNCILVKNNIRPAMLVQPADYNEASGKDKKTKSILTAIKKYYPELKQSEDYQTYQGIIVSKQNFNGETISLSEMGKILGYPCHKDFSQIGDESQYVIGIVASAFNTEVQLFVNVCKDNKTTKQMILLAKKAESCFQMYKELIPIQVTTYVKRNPSTLSLIRKLISKESLDTDDKDEVINTLWNMNGNELLNEEFKKAIQYDNPIHQGILLTVLNHKHNDPLSPFYPLQFHPEKDAVNHLLSKLLYGLLTILQNTRTSSKNKTKRKWRG